MKSLLIVSNRQAKDFLTDEVLELLSSPQSHSFDEISELAKGFSDRNNILLVDIESSVNLDETVGTLRRSSQDVSVVALISSDSLRQMNELKKMKVDVYVKCPVKITNLEQAIDALSKGRKYVDPGLSDSIVETFLNE